MLGLSIISNNVRAFQTLMRSTDAENRGLNCQSDPVETQSVKSLPVKASMLRHIQRMPQIVDSAPKIQVDAHQSFMWLKFSNSAIAMNQLALILSLLSIQDLELGGRLH